MQSHDTHFASLHEPGWAIYGNMSEQLPALNYTLKQYLQSWKYFIHVEDQLRFDLTFKARILNSAKRFIEAATPLTWGNQDFLKVVIHVRHGDINNSRKRKRGWTKYEPGYFNRSMAYYRICHPRVLFVVLSDDIQWCQRHIVDDYIVYSVGKRPIVDMAIASLCDHAIITIGSYGWWTAWFAGGVTVTQKNFPTPGTLVGKQFKRQDHYKPEWVAL